MNLSTAARDVLAERRRQIEKEGWTPEHDDEYSAHELAEAAACYCLSSAGKTFNYFETMWPWERWWFKASGPRRNLIKAAALILAEIERLDRAASGSADQPAPAPAPDDDGWIEWRGGECPVDAEAVVDVRFRVDEIDSGRACDLDWLWRGEPEYADIVAYRVVRESGEG